ncbi:MAG TPA: hypothetical protein VGC27_10840 [Rhizomicrobium sp.]
MAQLVVRNLEERVKERLRRQARRNGRSMEEEARDILRKAFPSRPVPPEEGLGTRLRRRFEGSGIDFEIPEFRGYEARPAKFEK